MAAGNSEHSFPIRERGEKVWPKATRGSGLRSTTSKVTLARIVKQGSRISEVLKKLRALLGITRQFVSSENIVIVRCNIAAHTLLVLLSQISSFDRKLCETRAVCDKC